MRRTKLEMYIDVLKIVAQSGSLNLSNFARESNISSSGLKKHLDFLLAQGMLEKQKVGKQKTTYSIAEKGIKVLRYFNELKQELQIIKQAEES